MNEVEFVSKSISDLLGRVPNFYGLVDASLDWQYMIEVVTVARAIRPEFQFVSGTEYMISASAVGATGMLSPLTTVAPRLVRELYELCRAEKYKDARRAQEAAAILFRVFKGVGVSGLKAADLRHGPRLWKPAATFAELSTRPRRRPWKRKCPRSPASRRSPAVGPDSTMTAIHRHCGSPFRESLCAAVEV